MFLWLISIILDVTNYITWAHQMSSFLIGRKLWQIFMGDITKPIKSTPKKDSTNSDTSNL